ncbi:DUF2231 domain-containing protein [Kovacikia minuta CCNUW1]|uniref:DUF2231 domain-containing protein n=1 Tax=Kovacikia minuta TaxID=2931930 RepID=UPI001CC93BCB|nr:DUF2231 domain-containing protein [Kovacikia minuta]UBF29314.1 DUF2231 domain-containing protein [Kovacikia minuta CCNUW1]
MLDFLPPLNDHNLPYPDTIHPIVVHFVIAMVLFAFLCDVIGYFTRNVRLFEVSWWNLFFATLSIFIAVLFGQVEAGLAEPYDVVEPVLNLHTLIGWSLSAILAGLTAWRFILRSRDPQTLPLPYLGVGVLITCLVCFQIYLGDKLVWIYGLHTVPVIEATRNGVL